MHFAFCVLPLGAAPPEAPEAERSCYSRGHAGHYVAWVHGILAPRDARRPNAARLDSFLVDRDQPREARWNDADYAGSGFDAGHLWPASYAADGASERDTFLLTNTMPQAPGLNRGQWARLEAAILARVSAGETAEIVTGPAFLARGETIAVRSIGDHQLWVPTHCWKAVAFTEQGAKTPHQALAWLIPNRAVRDFRRYRVSVDELEAAVGFDLFPGLDEALEATPKPRASEGSGNANCKLQIVASGRDAAACASLTTDN